MPLPRRGFEWHLTPARHNRDIGTGKISGHGVWANGHECSFESSEAETQQMGSRLRINDGSPVTNEQYSVSFATTPQVVIWAGGAR